MYSLLLIYEFWWVLDCTTWVFFFFFHMSLQVHILIYWCWSCSLCHLLCWLYRCYNTEWMLPDLCILSTLIILFNCNYRDFDFHHSSVSHGNDNIILISRTAVFHHFNKSSAIYSKSYCRSASQLVWLVDLCNKVHWKLWIHMMNAAAHAILFGCIFPDKF